jgi:hypothetical protein
VALADRDRIAALLAISPKRIPDDPDSLDDPKRYIVDLARNSNRAEVKAAIVQRAGSGRTVGPAYNAKMIEFIVARKWRADAARRGSGSLRRALEALQRL